MGLLLHLVQTGPVGLQVFAIDNIKGKQPLIAIDELSVIGIFFSLAIAIKNIFVYESVFNQLQLYISVYGGESIIN
jgi:hypothetical protein